MAQRLLDVCMNPVKYMGEDGTKMSVEEMTGILQESGKPVHELLSELGFEGDSKIATDPVMYVAFSIESYMQALLRNSGNMMDTPTAIIFYSGMTVMLEILKENFEMTKKEEKWTASS